MKIVSRAEWGAEPPRWGPYPVDMMPTIELWLHHSAGSGADETAIRFIQWFHQAEPPDGRGWSDIAYSFLVDNDPPDVDIFEGRGAGIAGGHTKGRNKIAHGLCILGDFSTTPPTPETIEALIELVVHGALAGWWPPGFTGGHREAPGADTQCPGDALMRLLPTINAEIRRRYESAGTVELWTFVDEQIAWDDERRGFVERAIATLDPRITGILQRRATERGSGIRLYLAELPANQAAAAYPSGAIIFNGGPYVAPAVLGLSANHEVGHVFDFWLFDNADRADFIDAMCDHQPQHGWGKADFAYWSHVREAWAQLFSREFGELTNSYVYHHQTPAIRDAWLAVLNEKLEDEPMALPFDDLDGWPDEVIEAAAWAKGADITEGTSPQTFSPAEPVTRAQAIVFLHRMYKLLHHRLGG